MAKDSIKSRIAEAMVPASMETALDATLDRALRVQRTVVLAYVDRLRSQPGATAVTVLTGLEKRYLTSVAAIGAASGGAAAVPGIGTAASVASAFAEVAAFVEATSLFTLAVAEVYGYRFDDPETRRALVLGIVLGDVGGPAIESAAFAGAHWAPLLARSVNREGIGRVNKALLRKFVTHFGARQGALAVGRALPFGVGAGIGAVGNLVLGRASVKAAKRAFGRPPTDLGPRIING
jgi:hypothetical protein